MCRGPGQGTQEEIANRDLLAELEFAEKKHYDAVRKAKGHLPAVYLAGEHVKQLENAPMGSTTPSVSASVAAPTAADASHSSSIVGLTAEQATVVAQFNDADADLGDSGSDAGGASSDSDEDSDEDDTAELMRELEKIKAERAAATATRDAEQDEMARKESQAAAVSGNPLLAAGAAAGSAMMRRRWDEDVVFRAQTATEPPKKKRFINDTIRSDFHRSFLSKYIK
jgi:protein CWC15